MSDMVRDFFKAEAKHARQMKRLHGKILAKWTDQDFGILQATRAARDSAVAALTHEQTVALGLKPKVTPLEFPQEVANA